MRRTRPTCCTRTTSRRGDGRLAARWSARHGRHVARGAGLPPRRTPSPRWKYPQVDVFICASERSGTCSVADGIDRARTGDRCTRASTVTGRRGTPRGVHADSGCRRRARRRTSRPRPAQGAAHLVEPRRSSSGGAEARFLILGGRARASLERRSGPTRKPSCSRGSGPRCCHAEASTCSVEHGPRGSGPRCSTAWPRQAIRGDPRGGIPEVSRTRDRDARAARRPRARSLARS